MGASSTDPARAAMSESEGYRPGAGVMLLNPAWQMPQGGIDRDETPRQAALRELKEETGTDKADILAESGVWRHYDLPADLAGRVWGGRYRGQRQKWFAMRFRGEDRDIDVATEEPEFDAWQWVAPELLPELIVPFKRRLYLDILAEFRDLVGR
jgi:putative (di)nucleoside polyphosphate hydrolase